jgi:hypothetical protein
VARTFLEAVRLYPLMRVIKVTVTRFTQVTVTSFIGMKWVVMEFEDVLDDFASIHKYIKSRIGLAFQLEKLINAKRLHKLFGWLNPRKHKWNFILLIVFVMGGSLMLVEVLSEGISTDMTVVLLVLGVFLGLEGAGIVLGYFFFAEFLGTFRKD